MSEQEMLDLMLMLVPAWLKKCAGDKLTPEEEKMVQFALKTMGKDRLNEYAQVMMSDVDAGPFPALKVSKAMEKLEKGFNEQAIGYLADVCSTETWMPAAMDCGVATMLLKVVDEERKKKTNKNFNPKLLSWSLFGVAELSMHPQAYESLLEVVGRNFFLDLALSEESLGLEKVLGLKGVADAVGAMVVKNDVEKLNDWISFMVEERNVVPRLVDMLESEETGVVHFARSTGGRKSYVDQTREVMVASGVNRVMLPLFSIIEHSTLQNSYMRELRNKYLEPVMNRCLLAWQKLRNDENCDFDVRQSATKCLNLYAVRPMPMPEGGNPVLEREGAGLLDRLQVKGQSYKCDCCGKAVFRMSSS
jgi:hypothetical protein